MLNETKFSLGGMNMITFKCLYKLTKEEVRGIVFDIKNGKSYTVSGWEDYYLQMQILLSIIIPFNKNYTS